MDLVVGRMDIACDYGSDVAIFMHSIVYWTENNAANHRNFFDGRYWTYNSISALAELYPLWSRDQIKRIIKKCRDADLLLEGNYSDDPYDRTKWYAPSTKTLEIYGIEIDENGQWKSAHIDWAKSPNRCGETTQCTLGEIAKCNKVQEYTQEYTPLPPKRNKANKYALDDEARDILNRYVGRDLQLANALKEMIDNRADLKAVNSARAIKAMLRELDKHSFGSRANKLALLNKAVASGWKTVYSMRPDELPDPPPQHVEIHDTPNGGRFL